jgi:hypothetical protein
MTKHEEAMKRLEEILWPERFSEKSFAAKLDQAIKKKEAQREFLLEKASKMWGGQVQVVSHGVFKR